MAYNAVSQADHEVASNATDSDVSRSPSPHKTTFQHLPLDVDHIGGGTYLQPAKTAEDSSMGRLGSLIRSMTSTSYDMVEEDDYDIADPPTNRRSNSLRRVAPLDTRAAHAGSPEPPLRSPITDTPVPLSHPTPDLQSLQGAYLNNVERLERSAEQLSSSSADIGSEIRKMDREQKRRSVSSVSNSVRESNPMKGTVPSSQGSIMSASRLAQVSEHMPEERFAQSMMHASNDSTLPPQPPVPIEPDFAYHDQYSHTPDEIQRPSSAASGDTFQQARVLFTDFDGVHYVPHDKGQDLGRQVSLTRPPLASRPESYKEPQTGENMVYYPAPVPMMLNLPPRLSQKPNPEREKRRTQLLGSVTAENRKSAPWLSSQALGDANDPKRERPPADLPPQLRASVFFEQPATPLDVEVKQASAVATLDSILDASTNAPVTAFTDHPYAGPVGSEVYAKHKASSKDLAAQKKKHMSRSTLRVDHPSSDSDARASSFASHHLYHQTEADAADIHEGTSLREGAHDGDDVEHDPLKDNGEESNEQEVPFTGPPSTLLAELEMRKHELRQRQRTAANSIGLHSTLLQLDAVAQKQSEHRRHRPVTLAWEDPDANKPGDDGDDDDVPLGMLFPEKATATDDNRPLGLMERRELEESEPLSRRRARLRGEPPPPPPRSPDNRPTTMYVQNAQEPAGGDSGDEGETLAERLKRLKGKDRRKSATGSEFADEILAEVDHMNDGDKEKGDEGAPEEETLAQRRARLQKEAESRNSTLKVPRYRRSMADLLHARRPAAGGRPASREAALHRTSTYQPPYDSRMSLQFSAHPGQPVPSRHAQYQGPARTDSFGYGAVHPNTFYSDAILGMNHLSYVAPHKAVRPGAETGQREMIDRWRQSIV
ncbi:hypothetical protein BDV27DRAFT_134839 [Aspergillus caelatus]|uniref:Uncharacterized protein n=1 Tax=Aspergillus caelatus TaxID=61420 RepID=A0A5N6ZRG5_9EURO|nr:uncharacterized protein BDV27DRAFT_134839 [Aspergillus caelatus]KAE8360227.1 hypothetical protein BDV27DRAFT_134839 [Aspergillus caelatus]